MMTEFVVYDLEYTSWEGAMARRWSGPGEHREIVQIGAVRLDERFRELAAMEVLVQPRLNPVLSEYFIGLTGITQDRLQAEGTAPLVALQRLLEFAAPDLSLVSNGCDGAIIAENYHLLGYPDPFVGRTIDVHLQLLAASDRTRLFSCELPEVFDLPIDGGAAHTALADARCVAAALAKVSQSNSKAFL